MKISLANLLLQINQKEKEINEKYSEVLNNSILTKDRELNGTETILNEVKDFDTVLYDYLKSTSDLAKYKNILAISNATTKTESGLSIIEAINKVSVLRRELSLFESLSSKSESLTRQSDGNGISSYYRVKSFNFNMDMVVKQKDNIQKEIQKLEADIQQTNATSFIEI